MTKDAPRVLLVEDDKPLRATLAATFKAEGYAVVEAGSVTSAKQGLEENSVDLAILDRHIANTVNVVLRVDHAAAAQDHVVVLRHGGRAQQER